MLELVATMNISCGYKDPTTGNQADIDAYLNCQGYYNFDTGVSDVAQGGAAPTNFNVGVAGVWVDRVGNVGIGTNAPGAKLAVESTGDTSLRITSGSTSNSILEFGDTGDHDVGRIDYDNNLDWMSFYTNGGNRMRITSEGYTTIGAYVLSPRTFIDTTAYYAPDNLPLLIHGGSGEITNEAGNCGIGFNTRYRQGHIKNAIICEAISWGRGNLHFCSSDTVSAGNDNYKVSLSDSRMVVKSGGDVGIGTTSPSAKLDVNGDVRIPNGSSFSTSITDAFTYDGDSMPHYGVKWRIHSAYTGGPAMQLSGHQGFRFFTVGSEKVTILPNGNVGIGTATPGVALDVNGTIRTNGTLSGVSVNVGSYFRNADFRHITLSPSYIGSAQFKVGFSDIGGFSDVIGFNTYYDTSGGNANLVSFHKNGIVARIYQQATK